MEKQKTQASGNEREKNFYFSLDSKGKHDRIDFISLLERETMTGLYHSKSGVFDKQGNEFEEGNEIVKLKDNTSRLLLSISFKHLLEGRNSQAEKVLLNVTENCSFDFITNIEKEKAEAKRKAVNMLNV